MLTSIAKYVKKSVPVFGAGLISLFYTVATFATTPSLDGSGTLKTLADNTAGAANDVSGLVAAICLVLGAILVVLCLVRVKQYAMDAQSKGQHPIGSSLIIGISGLALIFLPTIYNDFGVTLFGSGAKGDWKMIQNAGITPTNNSQ